MVLKAKDFTEGLCNFRGFKAHEVRKLFNDDLAGAIGNMNSFDAPSLPVRPVDVLFQQSETEDVRQFVLQDGYPISAVDIYYLPTKWGIW